jgi:transposase
MAESRRKFDQDFKEGAVRLVRETGHPIAQLAKDLGINPGTLANWVALDRRAKDGNGRLSEDERIELARLRRENAELSLGRLWAVKSHPTTRSDAHRREAFPLVSG